MTLPKDKQEGLLEIEQSLTHEIKMATAGPCNTVFITFNHQLHIWGSQEVHDYERQIDLNEHGITDIKLMEV